MVGSSYLLPLAELLAPHARRPTPCAFVFGAMPSSPIHSQWEPPRCAFMLQHLRFSRAPGGHAASIAGTSTKGGCVKLSPSESVDAFLGCGKYADRSSLPAEQHTDLKYVTGFGKAASTLPVRAHLEHTCSRMRSHCGCRAWRWTATFCPPPPGKGAAQTPLLARAHLQ